MNRDLGKRVLSARLLSAPRHRFCATDPALIGAQNKVVIPLSSELEPFTSRWDMCGIEIAELFFSADIEKYIKKLRFQCVWYHAINN
jgi:hypothetical protein